MGFNNTYVSQEIIFSKDGAFKEIFTEKDGDDNITNNGATEGKYEIKHGILYLKTNEQPDGEYDEDEFKLNCISDQELSYFESFSPFYFLSWFEKVE